MTEKLAYRVPEVADMLGLSDPTVWRMIRDGEIMALKARGTTLITREAVHAYLASRPAVKPHKKAAQS